MELKPPHLRDSGSEGAEISSLDLSKSEAESEEDSETLESNATVSEYPASESLLGPRRSVRETEERLFSEQFFGKCSPLVDRPFNDC